MRFYDNLTSINLTQDTVLTVGAFDGVHRGHQHLIGQMIAEARRTGRLAGLLTFHPHPAAVLAQRTAPKYLTTPGQKAVLLESLGLDVLVILPFDTMMADTPAVEFIEGISRPLHMRELWVGEDFALGRDRDGNITALHEMAERLGFSVRAVQPYILDGQIVSSTRIRQLLGEGEVAEAARLLNRYHSLAGEVVHGAGRGHRFGIPTANLQVRANRAVPMNGIYAVWAVLGDERHRGVANIGRRPSFDNGERTIEVHLLDFHEDIYGCDLLIEFVQWLRPEVRFANVEALYGQIDQDIEKANLVLSSEPSYGQPLPAVRCAPAGTTSRGHTRFEELDYVADVGIRAYGQNLHELFANAAYGMFSLMVEIDGLVSTTEHEISVSAADRETLLMDWLAELLYLYDTTGEVFISFDVVEVSDTRVRANVYGTFLARPHLEIKAVTYHDLRVEETDSGYAATVVFDV